LSAPEQNRHDKRCPTIEKIMIVTTSQAAWDMTNLSVLTFRLQRLLRAMMLGTGDEFMTPSNKNTVCLWYDHEAEAAARFYANTFPDSQVLGVHYAPADYPAGRAGDVITVSFTVMGIPCLGINGGPGVEHGWGFSFQVLTDDQSETDLYWQALIDAGGKPGDCGWCSDPWGLAWQITPKALMNAIQHPDPAVAQRAFQAMMTMGKIDVAAIERAVQGG
jgi:predicted 3-demethylubiquinone-9 3-methyltransferase (glyoxalase superfamily)